MKRLIPILILLLMTSCDPIYTSKFVIINNTDSDIIIESVLSEGRRNPAEKDTLRSVEIKPNAASIIFEYSGIGLPADKGIHFLLGVDTIRARYGNKSLTKDLFDRNNWTFKVIDDGSSTTSMNAAEYTLTLTEADFN